MTITDSESDNKLLREEEKKHEIDYSNFEYLMMPGSIAKTIEHESFVLNLSINCCRRVLFTILGSRRQILPTHVL